MLGYFTGGLLANGGFHSSGVGWCGKSTGKWRVLFGLIDYHCWLWTVTWPLTPAERSPKNQVPHPLFFLDPVHFFRTSSVHFGAFEPFKGILNGSVLFCYCIFSFLLRLCVYHFFFFFGQTKIWKEKLFDTTIWSTPKKEKVVWDFYFWISHKWLSHSIFLKLYF